MNLKEVARQFNIGTVKNSEKLTGGLVNTSYKVETTEGLYVVQKLALVIPPEATKRYAQIQHNLRSNGIFVPFLLTRPNEDYHTNNSTGHWRAFKYVPNDEKIIDTESCIISAAKTLGKFHSIMSKCGKSFPSLIDNFHNTKHYKERLSKHYSNSLPNEIKEYMSFLHCKTEDGLAEYPIIPIHGDPKLENFLFINSKVTALLDLDTIMDANPLIDIGDGMRSWCCEEGTIFNKQYFALALEAYNANAPETVSREDALNATIHITGELGVRFLTDSFEETYFAWDKNAHSSAKESHLAETRNLVKYIGSIENARCDVEALCPA